jgi:hypothetical protein
LAPNRVGFGHSTSAVLLENRVLAGAVRGKAQRSARTCIIHSDAASPPRYAPGLYIRRTTLKSRASGEPYYTYRLVESLRSAAGVRQRTLLNLGRHFDVPREHWGPLALRIEHLLGAQGEILGVELPIELEACAQRYAAQLLHARAGTPEGSVRTPDYHSVDVDTLEVLRPRRVGVEHVAWSILRPLELDRTLEAVGLNRKQVNLAIGTIVARRVMPGSELASYAWLCQRSGLGELLETDFERYSLMSLYRIADQLLAHKGALEDAVYTQERSLFDFTETITLYDLTNTYFEGLAQGNAKAARGHSKEKRSDCPLVTLALVLDGSGFPQRSEIFEGNVSEPKTLAPMLEQLSPEGGGPAATVVLDAGIACEENIAWLVAHGYPYLVVSRKRHREFDPQQAVVVKEQADQAVRIQRVVNPQSGEVELYCHSTEREKKDRAIDDRFEQALEQLRAGLSRKGTVKKIRQGAAAHRAAQTALRPSGQSLRDLGATRPRDGQRLAPAVALYRLPSGHPSRGLLSAHRSGPVGREDPLGDLHDAHRFGSGVSHLEVRVGITTHLPPQDRAHQRSSVHQRAGLPSGAYHSPPTQGLRDHLELGGVAAPARWAGPRDRQYALRQRGADLRAQEHPRRAAPGDDLPGHGDLLLPGDHGKDRGAQPGR